MVNVDRKQKEIYSGNQGSVEMKVNLGQAVKMFFSNSSLEMVYFEAIANALDAGATKISIEVSGKSIKDHKSFNITIVDNGEGFTDSRYEKFSNLFDVEESSHKGLGRLVYLCYFEQVHIESYFEGTQKRDFLFSEMFKDSHNNLSKVAKRESGTTLKMQGYVQSKVAKKSYVQASSIKQSILEKFYPRLFSMKTKGNSFEINIKSSIGDEDSTVVLDDTTLRELKVITSKNPVELYDNLTLHYSIQKINEEQSNPMLVTAICVDERTVPINDLIVPKANDLVGFEMIFLLESGYFTGKVDAIREKLNLPQDDQRVINEEFRHMVISAIEEEIPEAKRKRKEQEQEFTETYPHLHDYFDKDTVGYIPKDKILERAQKKFFKGQRDILEATELTDAQYDKSLDFSSRSLTEYVLFREKIISRLKSMTKNNSEGDIHDLIAPRRKVLSGGSEISTIYQGNAWLLDDKFMTYSKVLSDIEIENIYTELEVKGSHIYSDTENGRPDLTIILSDDPSSAEKVDVVVVELKKLGLKLNDKEGIISQLKQRARRLYEYYPNKIQRLWFYGVIDFDKEFKASIREDGFKPLYSKGELFCKTQEIVLDPDKPDSSVFIDLFLLSYDAMLSDAAARNHTFLEIIRNGIRQVSEIEY